MKSVKKIRQDCHDYYKSIMQKKGLRQPLKSEQFKCQNFGWLFIFIVLVLTFIGLGLYYLTTANTILNENYTNIIVLNYSIMSIKLIMQKFWRIIIGMFALSLFLPLICLALIWIIPEYIFYFGIASTILLLSGILGISAYNQLWIPLGLSSATMLLFILLVVTNFRYIPIGTQFLKILNNFISEQKAIVLVPLYALTTLIVCLCFWFITLICMQYSLQPIIYSKEKSSREILLHVYWIFMLIFFFLFMYYMKVYLIANIFSSWYYKKKPFFWRSLCKFNHSHIGSVTRAALTTPFVLIFSYLGPFDLEKNKIENDHGCSRIILFLYLRLYRFLMEIINKYAVMAMALTGLDFTGSAQFAFSILIQKYPFMFIANSLSMIIKMSGIVFSAGIPTLIGYALVQIFYHQDDTYDKSMFLLLIFFICSMLSAYSICLYSTTLCVACFYLCFHVQNKKLFPDISADKKIFDNLLQSDQIKNIMNKLHEIYQQTDPLKQETDRPLNQ